MTRYLLLLLLPVLAVANIGKITVLKGDVSITRDTKQITAQTGTILKKSDFIKTAKNAKVQIVFTDKTIFTIGKNSTLDIADYLYDENKPSNNKAKFNVLKGAFTSITGRIGKLNKSKFKLKTKSASIGIRGTVVKANQEIIMCTEGGITVTMLNGQSININAGNKVSIQGNKLGNIQKIQAGDDLSIGADITSKDEKESKKQTETNKKSKQQNPQQTSIQDLTSSDIITKAIEENTDIKIANGYSMKSEVKDKTLEINVNENTNMAKLTDGTALSVIENPDGTTTHDGVTSWGYWDSSATNHEKNAWIAGTKTNSNVIDNLKTGSSQTYTYNGKVIGSVTGADGDHKINETVGNEVNLNFDLGSGESNNIASGSYIKFQTKTGGQEWDAAVGSGTISGNEFSSSNIIRRAAGGNQAITGGNIEGSFYGSNAQQVGGTFDMTTGANTASGVFKATK